MRIDALAACDRSHTLRRFVSAGEKIAEMPKKKGDYVDWHDDWHNCRAKKLLI
jgi:hypothetical protein